MEENQTIEPFMIAFGIKSTVETIVDGVVGILTQGYASKFNVVDQDGEYQVPGSRSANTNKAQPLAGKPS